MAWLLTQGKGYISGCTLKEPRSVSKPVMKFTLARSLSGTRGWRALAADGPYKQIHVTYHTHYSLPPLSPSTPQAAR